VSLLTEDDDEISGKFVLVVSDLHMGSAYGLLPYGFVGSTGVELNLNMGQEYLSMAACGALKPLLNRAVRDEVVPLLDVVGRFCSGGIAKSRRKPLDLTIQGSKAAQVPAGGPTTLYGRATRDENGRQYVYVSRGSRYHSGSGAGDEEFFAAMVHARRGPDGRHTRPWTHLVVEDTLFDVADHQSVTIRYRSMPLEREIGFFLERCGRMRQEVPERVVIVTLTRAASGQSKSPRPWVLARRQCGSF
jgi:hypothetical protein